MGSIALKTGADKDENAPPKETSDDQSMEEGDGSIELVIDVLG